MMLYTLSNQFLFCFEAPIGVVGMMRSKAGNLTIIMPALSNYYDFNLKSQNLLSSIILMSKMRERERNVLFNDALNTFYLRFYGVRHMVKDHSDSEKGNPLPPHRLLLSINSKSSFICTIPQTG